MTRQDDGGVPGQPDQSDPGPPARTQRALPATTLPTILLGLGLGGFFDGIVLHQVLQWHHMLSAHTPPTTLEALELNTLADGLFHASTWVFTTVGLVLLWATIRHGAPLGWHRLVGGLLAGWGSFNLVEGIVDHHLLQVHHVREGPDALLYDVGFLVWGAVMLAAGVWLLRQRPGEGPDRGVSQR
jgi:uncharacterized membrane protein